VEKTVISVEGAPRPFAGAPYSQAIKAAGLVFTAGQLGIDPETGALVDGGIEAETHRVFANLRAVLDGAGSSLERVVKTTVFMADLGQFAAMNEVYGSYFGEAPPARSAFQVAALPGGASVEIEAVALAG
jgi:2-iminobutanoate/2-iminopropanoate deaminase